MSDPYELYLQPDVLLDRAPACVEVRRGPSQDRWRARVRVADVYAAERLLARWRREHPQDVIAIFIDGAPTEDQARRDRRLFIERLAREVAYLTSFAAEAEAEGQPEDARQYRRCADQLRLTLRQAGEDARVGPPGGDLLGDSDLGVS